MHASALEDLALHVVPFPRVTPDGTLIPGLAVPHPEECIKCSDRRCARESTGVSTKEPRFGTCYRGLGVVVLPFETMAVTLNGLVMPEQAVRLPRKQKKRLAAQVLPPEVVVSWYRQTRERIRELGAAVNARIGNTLGMLHDVQTAVSSLLRNAEEFVKQQPGTSFDAKVETLPGPAMKVVKTVQLLQARLGLLPLLTNPDAARYGQKHATPVYRVVDRLIRIMRLSAEKERVSIKLTGSSFNAPDAYESFETVPLVLIDNAIKYSMPGQTVEVRVDDVSRGVTVEITSFSPRMAEEERRKIFDRGFRGEYAGKVASRGSGLGLYLAQVVASAHGFRVVHSCDEKAVMLTGIEYCNNSFAFTVGG